MNKFMQRRYATADVFTDQMFGGNPVAVVLDAEGLSGAQMQAIALEFNYSETTFVLPAHDPAHTAHVRIFTPRAEVPFAGHPNVGTAFLLAREYQFLGKDTGEQFVFEEAAGLVPLSLIQEQGVTVGAEFRAPEALTCRSVVGRDAAASCLSLSPSDVSMTTHDPQVISVGLPFLVLELSSKDALRRAKPNLLAHESLLPLDGADAVFAYVREEEEGENAAGESTLFARMFSPLDGIVEDPATGSATAATIALLATIDRKTRSECRWRVHQGIEMGRPSVLLGRTMRGERDAVTVCVGGRCVAMFRGAFEL